MHFQTHEVHRSQVIEFIIKKSDWTGKTNYSIIFNNKYVKLLRIVKAIKAKNRPLLVKAYLGR